MPGVNDEAANLGTRSLASLLTRLAEKTTVLGSIEQVHIACSRLDSMAGDESESGVCSPE